MVFSLLLAVAFKKFRKFIRLCFLNFYDLYSLNMFENILFIQKALEETGSNYVSFLMGQNQNAPVNAYQQTLNKLIMLFCLVTHTILNNAGNDRSIHYDSPSDEQTEIQGKILAACINLVEYDCKFPSSNPVFFLKFQKNSLNNNPRNSTAKPTSWPFWSSSSNTQPRPWRR